MLFTANIENIISEISELITQSSLTIYSSEFREGFHWYYENGKISTECYDVIFPANAPIRAVVKIDDAKERKLVQSILPLMKNLISEMMETLETPSDNQYTWSLTDEHIQHFTQRDVEVFFDYAVDCIRKYQKYYFVVNIPARFGCATPELKPFWNEKDQLIDVSTFEPFREAFYYASKDIVVYPYYCHSYELKEKFADLYKEICKTGKLSISASRFSPKREYPETIYIQEEKLFGMPFNKENFKKLFKKEYGVYKYTEDKNNPYRSMLIPLYELQYVINPLNSNEVSFMLEEVIDIAFKKNKYIDNLQYGTDSNFFVRDRLIHFIFDNKLDSIVHFDLSYLYYNNDAYFKRIGQRLCEKTESATIKHKIFRIDGVLNFNIACSLIGGALDANHNPEVIRFLSGKD